MDLGSGIVESSCEQTVRLGIWYVVVTDRIAMLNLVDYLQSDKFGDYWKSGTKNNQRIVTSVFVHTPRVSRKT
jgi:hypothetical protein